MAMIIVWNNIKYWTHCLEFFLFFTLGIEPRSLAHAKCTLYHELCLNSLKFLIYVWNLCLISEVWCINGAETRSLELGSCLILTPQGGYSAAHSCPWTTSALYLSCIGKGSGGKKLPMNLYFGEHSGIQALQSRVSAQSLCLMIPERWVYSLAVGHSYPSLWLSTPSEKVGGDLFTL